MTTNYRCRVSLTCRIRPRRRRDIARVPARACHRVLQRLAIDAPAPAHRRWCAATGVPAAMPVVTAGGDARRRTTAVRRQCDVGSSCRAFYAVISAVDGNDLTASSTATATATKTTATKTTAAATAGHHRSSFGSDAHVTVAGAQDAADRGRRRRRRRSARGAWPRGPTNTPPPSPPPPPL